MATITKNVKNNEFSIPYLSTIYHEAKISLLVEFFNMDIQKIS
jgi:hypothetical protein